MMSFSVIALDALVDHVHPNLGVLDLAELGDRSL